MSLVVVFGLFFTFQQQILDQLERNEQDSSSNFVEHIQSISNITSDASNLERVNRWQMHIVSLLALWLKVDCLECYRLWQFLAYRSI